MSTDIQSLIEQRPYLKEPLELYDKWLSFQHQAAQLLPKEKSGLSSEDTHAYPRDKAENIFQLFVSTFDLPGQELEPIRSALEKGDLDFMRLSLDELPSLSLPYHKDELTKILFLFSKPYFLALHESYPLDGNKWEDGRCPTCSARPAIASITKGPQRVFHCSWCGTSGPYKFVGCPNCPTGVASQQSTLAPEEEKGFQVAACESCRSYIKIVDSSVLGDMSVDVADMVSLPLDIVAQEKGYARMTPNPIGLKKMA